MVRLAFLIFTRKQNLPEWNRMLASLCRNHFVVIGVGKVGYQVISELLEMRESIVAIEMASGSPLLGELFDKGVPVVQGNARMASVLEQAGVRQARAVIVTTSDDLTNLDAAITARELNADAKIVIRLFDETLATKVAGAFSMPTISTSQVAAPAFIAAATGRKIYQGFQLAGQYVHFTDIDDLPDRPPGRADRRRPPGGQADQHRHAPGRRTARQRQPRPRDRAGARRYHPGHRPDGAAADARGDEPVAGMRGPRAGELVGLEAERYRPARRRGVPPARVARAPAARSYDRASRSIVMTMTTDRARLGVAGIWESLLHSCKPGLNGPGRREAGHLPDRPGHCGS